VACGHTGDCPATGQAGSRLGFQILVESTASDRLTGRSLPQPRTGIRLKRHSTVSRRGHAASGLLILWLGFRFRKSVAAYSREKSAGSAAR